MEAFIEKVTYDFVYYALTEVHFLHNYDIYVSFKFGLHTAGISDPSFVATCCQSIIQGCNFFSICL